MEGNYNPRYGHQSRRQIIPLREMEGNYNAFTLLKRVSAIIPLREMEGNYNFPYLDEFIISYYTLERDGRELQLLSRATGRSKYYTLERDGRELQHLSSTAVPLLDYTLERDGRELQLKKYIINVVVELYP